MAWAEATYRRTAWSRFYHDGARRLCLAHAAPVHWERGPKDWAPLDLALEREASRWAITHNDYHLYVNDNGWIEMGPWRGEVWIRWRIAGAGFLHWPTRTLDQRGGAPTYDPLAVTVGDQALEIPLSEDVATVQSDLEWPGLWSTPGGGLVSLRIRALGQKLKTELVLDAAARAWLEGSLPAWPLDETFLGYAIRVDWSGMPRVSQGGIDLDPGTADFSDEMGAPVLHRIPPPIGDDHNPRRWTYRDIVGAMPLGTVYVPGPDGARLAQRPLVRRFWPDAGQGWAFAGQRLDRLAGLPAGDVVFDPTVDVTVGAGADDGRRYTGTGGFSNSDGEPIIGYDEGASYLSCHQFFRWTGVTIENTVITAHVNIRSADVAAQSGSAQLKIYGVDQDNPAAPTSAAEFDADPLTSNGVTWDGAWADDTWMQSPELKTIFQELTETYEISSDAVMLQIKNDGVSSGDHWNKTVHYDESAAYAAQLYIESYTTDKILTIDFEENDESDLTGKSVTANSYIDVNADAALNQSNFGVEIWLSSTTDPGYGYKDLDAPTTGILRVVGFIDIANLTMTDQDTHGVLTIDGSSDWIAQLTLYYDAPDYRLRIHVQDDTSTQYYIGQSAPLGAPEAEYLIEVTRASSDVAGNGTCTGWVNGLVLGSKSDLDNWDLFASMAELQMGATQWVDAGSSGYYWMDEVIAYRDYVLYERWILAQLYAMGEMGRDLIKTLAGALSPAGAAIALTYLVGLAGAVGSAGALVIQAIRDVAGTLTSDGARDAEPTKILAGEMDTIGATIVGPGKALAGGLGYAGDISQYVTFALAGALSWAAAVAKEPARALSGAMPSTGALKRGVETALAGALGLAGDALATVERALDGALGFVGGLAGLPIVLGPISGIVSMAGTVSRALTKLSFTKGALAPTGKAVKAVTPGGLAGALGSAGALIRQAGPRLAGILETVGALGPRAIGYNLRGALGPAGNLARTAGKALAGALSAAGAAIGERVYLMAGALAPAGDLARAATRPLAGLIKPLGALARTPGKLMGGVLAPAGALASEAWAMLAGALASAGELVGQGNKALSGALAPVGAIVRDAAHRFGGVLAPTGGAVRRMAQDAIGAIEVAGALAISHILGRYLPGFDLAVRREVEEEVQIQQEIESELGIKDTEDG